MTIIVITSYYVSTVVENISIEMVTNIIDKDTYVETVKSHSVMVTIE